MVKNEIMYRRLKKSPPVTRTQIQRLKQKINENKNNNNNTPQKSQSALPESELIFRILAENTADGILIISKKEIHFVNKNLAHMLGYGNAALLKAKSGSNFLIPADMKEMEAVSQKKQSAQNIQSTRTTQLIRKDGTNIDVEISISHILWREEPACLAVIHNISEISTAKEKLQFRENFFKLINDIANSFIKMSQKETRLYIQNALQSICEFTGAELGFIFEYHSDNTKISNTYEWCSEGTPSLKERFQNFAVKTYSWVSSQILQGKVLYYPKVTNLPPESETLKSDLLGMGIKSFLCVPLAFLSTIRGVLGFDSFKSEKTWSKDIIALMQLAAETFSKAMEYRESQQKVLESQEKFIKMFNTNQDLMALSNIKDGKFLDVNNAFLHCLDYKLEEVINRSSKELKMWVNNKDREKILSLVKKQGYCKDFETRVRTKSGKILYGLFSGSIIELASGPILFTTMKDITERKQAEQALEKSEENYRALFNSAGDAILQVNAENDKILAVNPQAVEMLGYTQDEFLKMDLWQLYPQNELDQAKELKKLVLAGEKIQDVEGYHYRHKNGNLIAVSITCASIHSDIIPFTIIHARNITERKQTEDALRESEENFRTIAEQSFMGIAIARNFKVQYVNQAYADILEYSIEEILDWKPGELFKIVYPDDKNYVLEKLSDKKSRYTKGHTIHMNYRILTKTNKIKNVSAHSKTISYKGESALFIIANDITSRIKAEEDLKISQERLSLALEATNDGLWDWNIALDTSYVSPRYAEILGLSPEEMKDSHKRRREIIYAEDVHEMEKNLRACLAGKADMYTVEYRIKTKDGKLKWILSRNKVVEHNKQGKPARIVGTITDITQQKEMEERLRHSEKMEAIGQLAGGIAHDFNNQLSSIVGYIELLREGVHDRPELERYTENIMKATKRAADLTTQLLAFARKGKYQSIHVNVHKTISEVIMLLQHSIDKRIIITTHLHAFPPFILGDPTQLQNALLNLAINARDAMPKGGELTFATHHVILDKQFCINNSFRIKPGTYLQIDVEDTGTGMDLETQKHIFEPFFTTKSNGKGTGMGMAAVYGTVKNHKGAIRIHSEIGRGTRIQLFFPQPAFRKPKKQTHKSETNIIKGSAHILLIDDEEMIRDMGQGILKSLGYKASLCANGAEAIEFYKQKWRNIDLVILDMVMPKLSGMDTFLELKKINPHIKAILASGYSSDTNVQNVLKAGISGFIQKPFSRKDLSEKIAQVLNKKM